MAHSTHGAPILEVDDIDVAYGRGRSAARVLRGITCRIEEGRTLGLVGESGSGKTTLARALIGAVPVSRGEIRIAGSRVNGAGQRSGADRKIVQLIPQNPNASLSPRRSIAQSMAEAIDPRRADVRRHRELIAHWLERVGIDPGGMDKLPGQFSGGQKQRIAIARALCVEPRLVIADEITSALDVSVQAEILQLLERIREENSLTMMFISHDLSVVRHVSDSVYVLYRGEHQESGPTETVFTAPAQDYTRKLLAAVPGGSGFHVRD